MGTGKPLHRILDLLEAHYGSPKPPRLSDPLEMILWENVAYLVSDDRREAAFNSLKKRVGTKPRQILEAKPEVLWEVAEMGGMMADARVGKLLTIARIASERFNGSLRAVLDRPPADAKRELKRFPGVGDPGAEKILLFTQRLPVLALESNGLRTLVRLGFGEEKKNYSATYRSAQAAVEPQIEKDCAWLVRAHQLLCRHGRETCKRTKPSCNACPVSEECAYYRGMR